VVPGHAISLLTKSAVECSPQSLHVTLTGGDLVLIVVDILALVHQMHLSQLGLPVLSKVINELLAQKTIQMVMAHMHKEQLKISTAACNL